MRKMVRIVASGRILAAIFGSISVARNCMVAIQYSILEDHRRHVYPFHFEPPDLSTGNTAAEEDHTLAGPGEKRAQLPYGHHTEENSKIASEKNVPREKLQGVKA